MPVAPFRWHLTPSAVPSSWACLTIPALWRGSDFGGSWALAISDPRPGPSNFPTHPDPLASTPVWAYTALATPVEQQTHMHPRRPRLVMSAL